MTDNRGRNKNNLEFTTCQVRFIVAKIRSEHLKGSTSGDGDGKITKD